MKYKVYLGINLRYETNWIILAILHIIKPYCFFSVPFKIYKHGDLFLEGFIE